MENNQPPRPTPPRLTCSVSRKITTAKYESVDLFISYSENIPENTNDEMIEYNADEMYRVLEKIIGIKERQVLDACGSPRPTLFELMEKIRRRSDLSFKAGKQCIKCHKPVPDTAERRYDPYMEEIHDEKTGFGYWCDECYQDACDEI